MPLIAIQPTRLRSESLARSTLKLILFLTGSPVLLASSSYLPVQCNQYSYVWTQCFVLHGSQAGFVRDFAASGLNFFSLQLSHRLQSRQTSFIAILNPQLVGTVTIRSGGFQGNNCAFAIHSRCLDLIDMESLVSLSFASPSPIYLRN